MIEEELQEYTDAIQLKKANEGQEHDVIDALADIIVLASNEITLNGYNVDLVMKQVVHHISSRNQNPEQAKRNWSNEKWQKDPNQDQSTIYKADYSCCKN